MQLRCVRPFGRWKPGDVINVDDCDAFDRCHWTKVIDNTVPDRTVLVEITPEQAREFFENRSRQQPPGQAKINQFREAMRAGEWRDDSLLLFSARGTLANGQHRMAALAELDTPQRFRVYLAELPDCLKESTITDG